MIILHTVVCIVSSQSLEHQTQRLLAGLHRHAEPSQSPPCDRQHTAELATACQITVKPDQ